MEQTLIPFGLLEGRLVRAIEVANGLACGCLCPGCKTSLIAANAGLKNVPHFRHAKMVDCRAGYESSLHKVAIALLVERKFIVTPDFEEIISGSTHDGGALSKVVRFKGRSLTATRADAEVVLSGVTPDVIYEVDGHQLLIEVRVAKKIDHDEHTRLRALGLSTLEINISSLDMRTICDPGLFEKALLHDPSNKHWVHSNRGVQMVNEAKAELATEIKAKNETIRLRLEAAAAERKARAEAIRLRGQGIKDFGSSRVTQAVNLPVRQPLREDKSALRQKILQRAELIAASIQRSVAEWGGQAAQCDTCLMANPPASAHCAHCGAARGLNPVTFTSDYARTALARLKCSPRVDRSFEQVPTLKP
jgi:hypothetical protein